MKLQEGRDTKIYEYIILLTNTYVWLIRYVANDTYIMHNISLHLFK